MKTFVKNLSIVLGFVVIAASGVMMASAQDAGTCRALDAQPNPVARVGVPGEAVSDGSVGCFVIHNGNRFVASAGAIGDISVIRQGVEAAVEVSGVTGSGGVVNFGREIQVCLRGTGSFVFRSSATTPRVSAGLPAVTRELEAGTYTCSIIGTTGTAILVQGPAAPSAEEIQAAVDEGVTENGETTASADDETGETVTPRRAPVTVAGAQSLSGCRIITNYAVRLREEPTTESLIITRLPYRSSWQATARTTDGEWYQVIYQDGQGWVSGNYVSESSGCTD